MERLCVRASKHCSKQNKIGESSESREMALLVAGQEDVVCSAREASESPSALYLAIDEAT